MLPFTNQEMGLGSHNASSSLCEFDVDVSSRNLIPRLGVSFADFNDLILSQKGAVVPRET